MKIRVQRFGIMQSGVLLAVIYGFMGVLLFPFAIIAFVGDPDIENIVPFVMCLMYPVMGFIGGAVGAAIYNFAAKIVGGLEVELDAEIVQNNTEGYDYGN